MSSYIGNWYVDWLFVQINKNVKWILFWLADYALNIGGASLCNNLLLSIEYSRGWSPTVDYNEEIRSVNGFSST